MFLIALLKYGNHIEVYIKYTPQKAKRSIKKLKHTWKAGAVAHTCNPIYSGG